MRKFIYQSVFRTFMISAALSISIVFCMLNSLAPKFAETSISQIELSRSLNEDTKSISTVIQDGDIFAVKQKEKTELIKIHDVNQSALKASLQQKEIPLEKGHLNFSYSDIVILLLKSFLISFVGIYVCCIIEPFGLYKAKSQKEEVKPFLQDYISNIVFYQSAMWNTFTKKRNLTKKQNFIILSFVLLTTSMISFSSTVVEEYLDTYTKINDQYYYSDLYKDIDRGNVEKIDVLIVDSIVTLKGKTKDNTDFLFTTNDWSNIEKALLNKNIDYTVKNEGQSIGIYNVIMIIISVFLCVAIFNAMKKGGGSNALFGSNGKFTVVNNPPEVTLNDIKALGDEVRTEIEELVDLINMKNNNTNYLGGKIPKGALLSGAPGVGKTMLAKALANATNCAFISASGARFGGMLQGMGVKDVQELFNIAKKNQPCIVFIDEFDALGRKRGSDINGSDKDSTLNEFLIQMDGFEERDGIFVIAATNFIEKLDPAVTRAGRFDRKVKMQLPDYKGRIELLKHYCSKIITSNDFDYDLVAHQTIGFSGADIANLTNEAALLAARNNATFVEQSHLDEVKDKLIMGHKLSIKMNPEEVLLTAFHEAGHAVVSSMLLDKGHDPVRKVSVVPRGNALGVTMYSPETERYSHSKELIEAQISSLYGGRIAEAMSFGEDKITTGASNDYEVATKKAEYMVKHCGLGVENNLLTLGYKDKEQKSSLSEEEKKAMNDILLRNYERAKMILKENSNLLVNFTKALLAFETIDEEQIKQLLKGKDLAPQEEIPEKYLSFINC